MYCRLAATSALGCPFFGYPALLGRVALWSDMRMGMWMHQPASEIRRTSAIPTWIACMHEMQGPWPFEVHRVRSWLSGGSVIATGENDQHHAECSRCREIFHHTWSKDRWQKCFRKTMAKFAELVHKQPPPRHDVRVGCWHGVCRNSVLFRTNTKQGPLITGARPACLCGEAG